MYVSVVIDAGRVLGHPADASARTPAPDRAAVPGPEAGRQEEATAEGVAGPGPTRPAGPRRTPHRDEIKPIPAPDPEPPMTKSRLGQLTYRNDLHCQTATWRMLPWKRTALTVHCRLRILAVSPKYLD